MSIGTLNYSIFPGMGAFSFEKAEQISGYLGKVASTGRTVLGMLAKISFLQGTAFADNMNLLAKRSKLVSLTSIPFSVYKIKSCAQKLFKSAAIGDHEGILMNSMSLASTFAGTVSSIGAVSNSLLDVAGRSSIQMLSDMGSPIGYFTTGIDITSKAAQFAKISKLYQEIDPSVFLKDELSMGSVKRRLQRTLDIRSEEKGLGKLTQVFAKQMQSLKQKRDEKILRLVPKTAQKDLQALLDSLSKQGKQPMTPEQRKAVIHALQKIRSELELKMVEDSVGMVAALVGLIGLLLISLYGMGTLPSIVQLIATALKSFTVVNKEIIAKIA